MKKIKQISLFLFGMLLTNFSFGQQSEKKPELSNGNKIENTTVKSSEQKADINSTNKKENATKNSKSTKGSGTKVPKLSQSDKNKEENEQ